jgi:hypothetical protein
MNFGAVFIDHDHTTSLIVPIKVDGDLLCKEICFGLGVCVIFAIKATGSSSVTPSTILNWYTGIVSFPNFQCAGVTCVPFKPKES